MNGSVAVIDYGMGNLHSVASALEHAGAERVVVSCDPEEISAADRVVFPGVGAIRDCMAEIRRLRCDELLTRALTDERKPVLAICVGMQALMDRSEENDGVDCLGLVPGEVRFFGHPLWAGVADAARFYFVHSYYVKTKERALVAGAVNYGVSVDAALARDNLFAVQFHPEKSHTAGLRLLKNFLQWDGSC